MNSQPSALSPLLVIVGETASGKTEIALEIAEKLDGEIICADSLTVRQGVNIGAAKPTIEEQKRIPHHLLDVAEPCEDFTAADFQRFAFHAIDEINNRGKLPIMVGGTGLYVDSVIYNYSFLPAGDRTARKELNDFSNTELLVLASEQNLDTRQIDIRNKRRIIRLIESHGALPTKQEFRSNTQLFGIQLDPETLRARIIKRTDTMIAAGLENEVRELVEKNGWDCEALKAIGYIEWREYLNGTQTLDEVHARIISSTLRLAKKQRTWFRRNKRIQWFNDPSKIVEIATTQLNKLQ